MFDVISNFLDGSHGRYLAEHGKEDHSDYVLFFLFIGLLLGGNLIFLISRYEIRIPYTVLIFVVGILLGLIDLYGEEKYLITSMNQWIRISPSLILFVFIPPTLFGCVINLNTYHVRGNILQGLVLAGPGAVLCTVLLGYYIYYNLLPFPLKWSFELSFVFASILSATDPVAVVAILSKSHSSLNRMTYIITGESILNDASALVLYNIFSPGLMLGSHVLSPYDAFIYLLKVIFISPIVGCLLGLGSVILTDLCDKSYQEEDTIVKLAVPFSCAYLSFFIGEQMLGVSGILCCCSAGWMYSWLAPSMFGDNHTLHSFWNGLEWIANTVLFMLAGLLVCTFSFRAIRLQDIANLIVIYLIIMIIRAVMVAFFYPVISRIGKGCSPNEAAYIAASGLRGLIAIALALSVAQAQIQNLTNISHDEAQRLLFYVNGFASLTLFINASLAEKMLVWFRVGRVAISEEEVGFEIERIRHYARKRMLLAGKSVMEKLPLHHAKMVDECCVHLCLIKQPESAAQSGTFGSSSNIFGSTTNLFGSSSNIFGSVGKIASSKSSPSRDKRDSSGGVQSDRAKSMVSAVDLFDTIAMSKAKRSNSAASAGSYEPVARIDPALQYSRNLRSLDTPATDEVDVAHTVPRVQSQLSNDLPAKVNQGETAARASSIELVHPQPRVVVPATLRPGSAGSESYCLDDAAATPPPKMLPSASYSKTTASSGGLLITTTSAYKSAAVGVSSASNTNGDCSGNLDEAHEPEESVFIQDIEETFIRRRPSFANQPSPISTSGTGRRLGDEGEGGNEPGSTPLRNRQKRATTLSQLNEYMTTHIRDCFLQVVKTYYWKCVHAGQLPRHSVALHMLLSSVEVGLETIHEPGLQDWEFLDAIIENQTANSSAQQFIAHWFPSLLDASWGILQSIRSKLFVMDEDVVSVLVNYIAAHEYAQAKIPIYIGEEAYADTIEQAVVVRESKKLVNKAQVMLSSYDSEYISLLQSKLLVNAAQFQQQEQLESLVREGIVMENDAHILFKELYLDRALVSAAFNASMRNHRKRNDANEIPAV